MKDVWIATTNKGKFAELKMLLERELPDFPLHSLNEFPAYSAPPETGATFLENARIKAKSLKGLKQDAWVLAEDSGLEVPGLGNLPGIHSARYAGPKASDSENVAKLLKMMQIRMVPNRNARFFCAMVVFTPDGQEWNFEGELAGVISKTPQGQLGFGYDPVFIPAGETKTLAELGPGFKNKVSHRSAAAMKFVERVKNL